MVVSDGTMDAVEVAQVLNVSKNTVYNLVKAGELQAYRVGRKMRFTRQNVDDYLDSQAAQPCSAKKETERSDNQRQGFRIAGTEMVTDILANYLGSTGVPISRLYANSHASLAKLYTGEAEGAVVHLYDHRSDSYNIPYVAALVPGTSLTVIRLGKRRTGLLVVRRNPKGLRNWNSLFKEDVSMVNRERGAASRILLDEKLLMMDVADKPAGYDREVSSQLAMAAIVAAKGADVCVGSEQDYHRFPELDFIPLHEEVIDLVFLRNDATHSVVKYLKNILQSAGLKEELKAAGCIDTSTTGNIVYEC